MALLFAMLAIKDDNLQGKTSPSSCLSRPNNALCSKSMNTEEMPWWEAKKRKHTRNEDMWDFNGERTFLFFVLFCFVIKFCRFE